MIPAAISLVALAAFGYLFLGPLDPSYSPRGWAFLVAFREFMYVLVMLVSLVLAGAVTGQTIAPALGFIGALVYAALAAAVTGLAAGLYVARHR